ncbi:hypothetical protein Tco_1117542 [Tanacetum coccineum]
MKREGKDFSGRTPIISQPSSSKPQKKKSRRKQRKHNAPIEPTNEETLDEAHVSMPSYDPSQSGKDKMKLIELMNLCTQLESRVLTLETTKSTQALEIESLKKRVKSLEKRKKSRTPGFKRIRKGRKISDPDVDAEVTLVDETQEMNDDNLMFDTDVLEEQEKDVAEKEVGTADPVTTAGEVVTTANVEISTVKAPTTTIDELTLAQTLIEIKVAKPKAVTSVAITTTTTGPKARWADRLLAERLQRREQEELTDEEKAKLFMEFMEKRRKHCVALKAQEKRNRPPTKTQKRNQMSIYLKHMEAQKISGKKDERSSKKAEIAQDSSAKRVGDKMKSNMFKK